MINNVLKFGEVLGSPLLCDKAEDQTRIVNALLLICLVCVPLMLFVKPWILDKR